MLNLCVVDTGNYLRYFFFFFLDRAALDENCIVVLS